MYYFFKLAKREIQAKRVKEHKTTCQFRQVPCPNQCLDDDNEIKRIMNKDLELHVKEECPKRNHTCNYCGEKGTYINITQVHDTLCKKKVVQCPYDACTTSLPRQDIEKHLDSDCPFQVVPCVFKKLGCKMKMTRKDMAAHELESKLHLKMATNLVDRGRKCMLVVCLIMSLSILSALIIVLVIQKELAERVLLAEKEHIELADRLLMAEKERTELADGVLLAEKEQVKLQVLHASTPLQMKIFAFQDISIVEGHLDSSSFYTHPEGYLMKLKVFPKGRGAVEGTHVSVLVSILKEEHDSKLKWPFVGNLTVTLMNQLEDNNHYARTIPITTKENARVGKALVSSKFAPLSVLNLDRFKNTHYLKDDTLYFQVSVQVACYKPWLERK